MARRVRGEGSVILTHIPYTNWSKQSRLHWYNFMAVSLSFVAVLSLLCCGVCGAETEFSILEEAQVLAVQMKKLSSQELGVFTMQVTTIFCFDFCQHSPIKKNNNSTTYFLNRFYLVLIAHCIMNWFICSLQSANVCCIIFSCYMVAVLHCCNCCQKCN